MRLGFGALGTILDTVIEQLITDYNRGVEGSQCQRIKLIYKDGSYMYIGEALAGTPESTAKWRIQRIEFLTGDDIELRWAGTGSFDRAWSNRASETYN